MDKIYSEVRQDGVVRVGRNEWELFYGYGEDADGNGYNWRTRYNHRPTLDEIKKTIFEQISANTAKQIVEGYEWRGKQVWLSMENQSNYTRDYIMAKNGDLSEMPTIKLGSDDEAVLYTFANTEELCDFATGIRSHIQSCLNASWDERENINWSAYDDIK